MLGPKQCVCTVACLLVWSASGLADDPVLLQGWATEGAGTTGGEGGTVYLVSNAEEFARALTADAPKIIRVTAAASVNGPRLEEAGVQAGLAVHIGAADGDLAARLTNHGRMLVHALALDDAERDKARTILAERGLAGLATVVHIGAIDQ